LKASNGASGAIIGSAFVKLLGNAKNLREEIVGFVKSIKGLK
jgi:tryptophan synthase alpha chain